MRRFTPETNPLRSITKDTAIPFAAELDETANLIVDDTTEAILNGKMSGIEAAGRFSLSTLLAAVASGKISIKDSFTFLKTIAEKKTPDPVVRIEQHQTVDLRGLLFEAVAQNPGALEQTISLALAARQQIQERLDACDGSLSLNSVGSDSPQNRLQPVRPSDSLESRPIFEQQSCSDPESKDSRSVGSACSDWHPGEPPPEIKLIRREVGASKRL